MAIEFFHILGVRISAVNLKVACSQIETWIEKGARTYVCVAPVSTLIDCQNDREYRQIVNSAGMVTPDGMPLVWVGRRRCGNLVQRTYGPDLMTSFCALSESKGYKHFFYGGSSQANRLLIQNLKSRFPKLIIAGQHAPAYVAPKQQENPDVIDLINASGADVLWVGLGSPKQDFWMAKHRALVNVSVMIGVGAAFDFLGGTKRQAPRWMQRCGLEWAFRLCCEPRRLWRRYLYGNARFIYLFMTKELFRKSDHRLKGV